MISMGEGLSIQDREMRIVYQNKFMIEIFGKHTGEYCYAVYEKRNKICEDCPLVQSYKTGKPVTALRIGITKDGTPFRFENTASVLRNSNGKIVAGIELCRIVENREKAFSELKKKTIELETAYSELKKTQRQLIETSKMAAVGQLAGGVAHEINNPMAVILGFSQVILKQVEKNSPFWELAKHIEKEVIRCKNLIQDLLVFSRTAKITKGEVNLTEITQKVINLTGYQIKLEDIKIIKELQTNVKIFGDENALQQVITNLIINAKDAIPDRGEIKVRVWKDEKNAFLSVKDTGRGISKETLERMFEPFYTTKDVGKGTGLGLSLVHGIIKEHNGIITVDTEVGKGSCFTISFPFNSERNL
jgi:signal transduction histidine kinase